MASKILHELLLKSCRSFKKNTFEIEGYQRGEKIIMATNDISPPGEWYFLKSYRKIVQKNYMKDSPLYQVLFIKRNQISNQ